MSEALLHALSAALPELEDHAPQQLDGCAIGATLSPADTAGVARALREISRSGLVAIPRGGGRHLALGNPPLRADLFLSTRRLDGVEAMEPAEGVCRAAAGTPLATLRRAADAHGVEVPIDGPGDATLGGALAAASCGPRSHGFGRVRDAVLGLDVVLGSGEATRCGGRVVKNVTGYDLAKLYTGSLGTLCVITAAWLRLRPQPELREVHVRGFTALAQAVGAACAAAHLSTSRVCALRCEGAAQQLVVELGGDPAALACDARAIGGEQAGAPAIADLEALQWGEGCELRVRIAALPSELAAVIEPLRAADGRVLAYPGPGLVYALFDADALEAGTAAALRAAHAASGPLRFELAPLALKRERCVFGARDEEVALFRALKQRFDPAGALSRGRFAGRL